MASGSAIAAVIAKYNTLTAANFPNSTRPPIWLDEAPQEGTAGTQQRLPYVIIRDGGGLDEWDQEVNIATTGSFTLEVYYSGANALANCDAAMSAILWNGSAPNLRLGIAFTTLSLTAPLYGMANAVKPTKDQHSYAGLDYQGQRAYRYSHDFAVTYYTRGTG